MQIAEMLGHLGIEVITIHPGGDRNDRERASPKMGYIPETANFIEEKHFISLQSVPETFSGTKPK